jgi:polysaccharide biosynthesis PFTS motif protein
MINIFKRFKKKKVFKIYNGYKLLKNKNNLKFIAEFRRAIENKINVNIKPSKKDINIHNLILKELNLNKFIVCFNNHFLYNIVDFEFNKSLLQSLKSKFLHPFPNIFKNCFEENNIKFSKLSLFYWHIKLFFEINKTFIKILFNIKIKLKKKFDEAIYVDNNKIINKDFFLNTKKDIDSNNFFWLLNHSKVKNLLIPKYQTNNCFDKINNDLFVSSLNFFEFSNLKDFLVFVMKTIFYLILFNILQFTKYWRYSFMYFEIMKCKSLNLLNFEKIKFFYFDNNYMFNRPLWTFLNQINQQKIYVYFVSSNFEFIEINNLEQIPYSGYSSLSWDNYIVWDERQKIILKKYVKKNINIILSRPIPNFNSSKDNIDLRLVSNSLILFDVQPYRFSRHIHLGYPNEYYAFKNVKKFYDDILEAVNDTELKIFYKRKRETQNLDKRYLRFLELLEKSEKLIKIDSEQNIFRLLNNDLNIKTISMPFTGPAYISKYFGKSSFFYDPSGSIKVNPYDEKIKIINEKNKIIQEIFDAK